MTDLEKAKQYLQGWITDKIVSSNDKTFWQIGITDLAEVLVAYASHSNSELVERVQKLESSLIFANELLAFHNMAVCDKHPVSWKLDFAKSCPECAAPETRNVL